jgi:hypothetical protein
MKKIIIIITLVLSNLTFYSQNFQRVDTNPKSPNFEYFGCMNEQILMRLNEDEIKTFNECLKFCGFELDSLGCVGRDFVKKYVGEKIDYSEVVVKKNTYQDFYLGQSRHEGTAKLDKAKIFVYIKRFEDYSAITVQIYY